MSTERTMSRWPWRRGPAARERLEKRPSHPRNPRRSGLLTGMTRTNCATAGASASSCTGWPTSVGGSRQACRSRQEVRALVEHHAFRTCSHGRIRHLPRAGLPLVTSCSSTRVAQMTGVCRLSQPRAVPRTCAVCRERSRQPSLHVQHDCGRLLGGRLNQDPWQIGHRACGLDLEDEPEFPPVRADLRGRGHAVKRWSRM